MKVVMIRERQEGIIPPKNRNKEKTKREERGGAEQERGGTSRCAYDAELRCIDLHHLILQDALQTAKVLGSSIVVF